MIMITARGGISTFTNKLATNLDYSYWIWQLC